MTVATQMQSTSLAGRRLGRYEVLTQLASGGMAGVYIARSQGVAGFERLVAVKVLHPHIAHEDEFISMFLDEARLAARIRHPNVVATLDISDTADTGYFLVMEYIEGDHLGALLRAAVQRGQRLPVPVAVRIVHDALSGLSAAHTLRGERGEPLALVHRDVSPHNILVGTDGIARLTDFGVAKAEVRLSSTRDGQFKGKLGYMSPEHASTGQADQRSDLFSMGIVLWESLTGQRLFRAETNAATLNKILNEPIPRASALLPELTPFDAVLEKALARDPDARFQNAEELMEALEQAAEHAGGTATTRKVGSVVKHLVGDKVAEEHERVRKAIDELGHSDELLMPLPLDGSGSVSHVSMPKAVSAGAEDRRRGPRVWLALAAVLLLLLAGAAVFALSTPTEDDADLVARPPEGTTTVTSAPAEDDETPQATAARTAAEPEGTEAAPEAVAGEPEGQGASAADTEPLHEVEAERERTKRGRRARRNRRQRTMTMTAAMTEPNPDDELLSNPYR